MTERPAYEWVRTLAEHSVRYEWLLEHGREWHYEEQRLPDDVQRGPYKECYSNAGREILVPGGNATYGRVCADANYAPYRYVEGVAWCGTIPVEHAWLVDEDDNVIDPTWVHDGTCGFCLGEGTTEGECECEDEEDGECWGCEPEPVECFWCYGSGRDPVAQRDSTARDYFGVVIEAEDLRRHVVETGTWGVLSDPEWYQRQGVV